MIAEQMNKTEEMIRMANKTLGRKGKNIKLNKPDQQINQAQGGQSSPKTRTAESNNNNNNNKNSGSSQPTNNQQMIASPSNTGTLPTGQNLQGSKTDGAVVNPNPASQTRRRRDVAGSQTVSTTLLNVYLRH
jgi:hypothetical protein